MTAKFRVDVVLIGNVELNLRLEDWLNELVADRWKFMAMIPYGDEAVLVIHRRRKSWWMS